VQQLRNMVTIQYVAIPRRLNKDWKAPEFVVGVV
jgi:hypothetical protein